MGDGNDHARRGFHQAGLAGPGRGSDDVRGSGGHERVDGGSRAQGPWTMRGSALGMAVLSGGGLECQGITSKKRSLIFLG